MKYILFIVLFFCFSYGSSAQKRTLVPIGNMALNSEDNVLIYKFDIPNSDLLWSRIFVNNNRLNVSYCRMDSVNIITTYNSAANYLKWTKTNNEIPVPVTDTMCYRSGIHPTIYGSETHPVYFFYGDSVLNYSYLENRNSEWIGNRKLAVTLGGNNSVIGVVSGTFENSYVLFNSMKDNKKNYIIKAHSIDNGHNWNLTTIAIKHNIKELKGWCMASRAENPQVAYVILTDNNNTPYYSQTNNGGVLWSYPKKISTVLSGDNYKMTINNGYVVIAFRKTTDNKLSDHNDMMLWHGSLQEFVSDQKRGNLMKIIDNDPDATSLDFTIEDVTFHKSRHYFVLIKNFSEGDSSLQIHLIRRIKN